MYPKISSTHNYVQNLHIGQREWVLKFKGKKSKRHIEQKHSKKGDLKQNESMRWFRTD